ncbi:hypothetical protein [Micromonospora cremea]|uniref:Uncharacterized protein n=1 Tax=Micromonospora cremea TaxID=709881 RepID=A0A1N5VN71_9ACTN|nr:hypothetical protein [Micromonospora cremea]SIM74228.1 hypothetical protein SAMN04489832_1741 [Micromonospora cremea]
MSRHDEPNEYGFAGDATAPEPQPGGKPDEQDLAEEVAVPGDDLTEPAAEALSEETEERRPAERGR